MAFMLTGCGNSNNANQNIVTDPQLATKIFYKTEPTIYSNQDFGDVIVSDDKIVVFPVDNSKYDTINVSVASNVLNKYDDLTDAEWAEIRGKFGNKYDTGYRMPYLFKTDVAPVGEGSHTSVFFRCLKDGQTIENPELTVKMTVDTDHYGFVTNMDFNNMKFEQSQ